MTGRVINGEIVSVQYRHECHNCLPLDCMEFLKGECKGPVENGVLSEAEAQRLIAEYERRKPVREPIDWYEYLDIDGSEKYEDQGA